MIHLAEMKYQKLLMMVGMTDRNIEELMSDKFVYDYSKSGEVRNAIIKNITERKTKVRSITDIISVGGFKKILIEAEKPLFDDPKYFNADSIDSMFYADNIDNDLAPLNLNFDKLSEVTKLKLALLLYEKGVSENKASALLNVARAILRKNRKKNK